MLIKAGVDISRLKREIRRALPVLEALHYENGTRFVVTSTYEGNHGAGSLHYCDDAFDSERVKEGAREFQSKVKERLSKDYDVVLEGDHLHIEYDPK